MNLYEEEDSLSIHWSKAKQKLSERKLMTQGIIPWQINRTYLALVEAFKTRNISRIIQLSADLGHYIADAYLPLNYQQQIQWTIHESDRYSCLLKNSYLRNVRH